jgi:hypothetical protein
MFLEVVLRFIKIDWDALHAQKQKLKKNIGHVSKLVSKNLRLKIVGQPQSRIEGGGGLRVGEIVDELE